MKKICSCFVLFFTINQCFSQKSSTAQSSHKNHWGKNITEAVKQEFGITFPIFKVYDFEDKNGPALIVLTESNDSVTAKGEPINSEVATFMLRGSNTNFVKEWESKYSIQNNNKKENSIWYWTKYFECCDVDNDGLSETFLIFGTAGENGISDGRIFIEIYYKNKKISIEHQNAIIDLHRSTIVDKTFYNLPTTLQDKVKYKIKQMITAKQAIFPANWQQSMTLKKTEVKE